ncbi:MAG: hypothetical protein GX666_00840 [Tissierellia bacterium]|nr:hypothetical protein [Tissierellia bacterium]
MNNKKLMTIGVVICLIAILAGATYEYQMKLDDPIFLKSYIELPIIENSFNELGIGINFITNYGDDFKIVDLKPIHDDHELDDAFQYSNIDYEDFWRTILNDREPYNGRYKTNFERVLLNYDLSKYDGDIKFSKIKLDIAKPNEEVYSLTKDIGRIIYYKDEDNSETILKDSAGSGASGTSYMDKQIQNVSSTFQTKDDVTIKGIESELLKDFEEYIDITINGKDYREMIDFKIGANYEFYIAMRGEFPRDINIGEMIISPRLVYEDSKGNVHKISISSMYMRAENEANKIVKELRGK